MHFYFFLTFLTLLDLSERFRTLTVADTQVRGLQAFLDWAYGQYEINVLSYAKDLQLAQTLRPRTDPFWVDSKLCLKQEDAVKLFDAVDEIVANFQADPNNNLVERVYEAHGKLLNYIAHTNGHPPVVLPPLPPVPSFASKHASHTTQEDTEMADDIPGPSRRSITPAPVAGSSSLMPPAPPPSLASPVAPSTTPGLAASVPPASPPPIPSSAKGKGRAVDSAVDQVEVDPMELARQTQLRLQISDTLLGDLRGPSPSEMLD